MNIGKFLCGVAGLALAVSPTLYGQAGFGRGFGHGARFGESMEKSLPAHPTLPRAPSHAFKSSTTAQ